VDAREWGAPGRLADGATAGFKDEIFTRTDQRLKAGEEEAEHDKQGLSITF
jgi:hypothetical protein